MKRSERPRVDELPPPWWTWWGPGPWAIPKFVALVLVIGPIAQACR